jgi:hypothetical protein
MTSASYIEKTREPADLSTFAGQAAHYAGVRARLSARPLQVPAPPIPIKLPERRVSYGVPINLLSPPSARNIIHLVGLKHGVSTDAIVGPRRDRVIVAVRDEAIRIVHGHCEHLSLPMIGRIFGDRDHTTILHSIHKKVRAA